MSKRYGAEEYEPPPDGLFADPKPPKLYRGRLVPPEPPPVLGETYSEEKDGARLGRQYLAVVSIMASGHWHTLAHLSASAEAPEASVSARLRDMRRGGWTVERRRRTASLWEYRATRR